MPSANRCPDCRETIHPFAATCPSCGADLDAYRRRRLASSPRRPRLSVPRIGHELTELLVIAAVLVLLSTFAPLYGAVISLIVVWRAEMNSLVLRRNVAVLCAAWGVFNLVFPSVFYIPHVVLGLR